MKEPNEQFQIGDRVLYMPEGVITEIDGYLWSQKMGKDPFIQGYELRCGITVREDTIRKLGNSPTSGATIVSNVFNSSSAPEVAKRDIPHFVNRKGIC